MYLFGSYPKNQDFSGIWLVCCTWRCVPFCSFSRHDYASTRTRLQRSQKYFSVIFLLRIKRYRYEKHNSRKDLDAIDSIQVFKILAFFIPEHSEISDISCFQQEFYRKLLLPPQHTQKKAKILKNGIEWAETKSFLGLRFLYQYLLILSRNSSENYF